MPRDPSGTYTTPVGTDGVPNFPIESSKYNVFIHDVETDLNTPRPISSGGTGAVLPDEALDNLSAEKFKQIVTEWDSMVWRAGSFYAATTAIGIAPVAGHAFAGIAYYANATDLVLEATDLTDVSDPTYVPQYIRVMTAGAWGPWTRKTAIVPIPGSLGEYTFNDGITFPPGSGQVRFNNATQNSTTEVFISHMTVSGVDNSGVIPFALKSGYDFYIQDKDEPAKWKMFTATADPVLSGGDYRVTATFKSGGTDVVTANRILVGANSGASASTYAVRYDAAQSLTAAQRSQARANIDVTKKNYIINGAMMVNQEWAGSSTGVNGNYPVDQFQLMTTATGVPVAQQITFPADGGSAISAGGSPNRLRVTITVAVGSVAAGNYLAIADPIEGLRVTDLKLGTAVAKTVVLQFGVKAPAGTYCVRLSNGVTSNRNYVAEYVIAAGEANTDVIKTFVIPLDTLGTWARDNTYALSIQWGLMGGSSVQTATVNSWTTGSAFNTANQFNLAATFNNMFELFDVSLTEGTVAPPFQVPDYASELEACQRYWQPVSIATDAIATAAGQTAVCQVNYPVAMRAVPTFTETQQAVNNATLSAWQGPSATSAAAQINSASGARFYYYSNIFLNARL